MILNNISSKINIFFESKQNIKYSEIKIWKFIQNHVTKYPSPFNLNIFWNFGFLSLIFFVLQILSGVFLAMYYTADVSLAYDSVQYIVRNINYGSIIRDMHRTGASFLFLCVFIHVFRAIKISSYAKQKRTWISGVIILVILMATSFLGYVLPWSQMSFWAATVITNMIGSIPVIGNSLLLWLWGGFSVSNPTLHRIYVLHFLLPFIMLVLVIFHILFLHEKTSSNPIHNNVCESLNLAPYFVIKDFVFFLLFLIPYLYYVLINPDYLSHPDTYIKANPMQTPNHIVPEWYFLIFYTMLRAIPSKLGGILVMAMAIIFLLLLSFFFSSAEFTSPVKTKFIYDFIFWMFLFNCCLLTYLGAKPVEYPYIFYGRLSTFLYFFYLILLVLLEKYEVFLFVTKIKK